MLVPGESLLVWGSAPGLYFYSGRAPATGFLYISPLQKYSGQEANVARFCREAEKATAEAVVIDGRPRTDPPAACLRAVLEARYVRAPDLAGGAVMRELWLKKDGAFAKRLGRAER